MSRTRVNLHVRRSGAVVAGALLLLTGWLPVATATLPPDHRNLPCVDARWNRSALSWFAATTSQALGCGPRAGFRN